MFGFSRQSWSRVLREGSWVIAGQAVTFLAGLAGIRLFTELADPSVFGEATLWLGIQTLSRNFVIVPLSMFQMRFHSVYDVRGEQAYFLERMRRLTRRGTQLMLVVTVIGYLVWVLATSDTFRPMLLGLLLVMIVIDALRTLYQNRLTAERQQKWMAFWAMTESVLTVILTVLALLVRAAPEWFLLGTALAWGMTLLLLRPRHEDPSSTGTADPGADRELHRRLLTFGLPFVILALLTWILHFGNRFVLGLHGTEIVGVFSAAFGLASKPAIVATGLISNVARPVLFNAESAGRTASARKIFLIWFGVALMAGAAVALGFLLLTPWLTRTLLAVEYRPGAEAVILWIVVGYCIYGLVNVIENRIMSFNRSASLIAPVAVGAIVTLGLNFLLIPRHGSLGAAYASAGGFAAQFLATLLALLRLPAHDTAGTPEPAHT